MHNTAHLLLLGASDAGSSLHRLSGHSDILHLIWSLVRQARTRELLAAAVTAQGNQAAFAHVENVEFPSPRGLNVNMMPFVMGTKSSLPEELHGYWPIIECCVQTLYKEAGAATPPAKRIGYLTVHESDVQGGTSQRRPGLHT